MIKRNFILSAVLIAILGGGWVFAGTGNGNLGIGYITIDDEGNKSADRATYNLYEGVQLSLNGFRYMLDNGIVLNADFNGVPLKNRNLAMGISRSGLFGADFYHNRYRRNYDFDGAANSRRNRSGTDIWVYPVKQLKIYMNLDYVDVTGRQAQMFDFGIPDTQTISYDNQRYSFGARFAHRGRMLQADFGIGRFDNRLDDEYDQDRREFTITGHYPIPRYERLVLTGVVKHFKNEFAGGGQGIRSDAYMGTALLHLNTKIWIKYLGFFNRAKSDSDLVATDNLAHAFFVSFTGPQKGGLTIGYQVSVNDDYDRGIDGSAYYASAWYKPMETAEVRGEYGLKLEDVASGTRLIGDREDSRYRLEFKWRPNARANLKLRAESKNRTNDQLGTEYDFMRYSAQIELGVLRHLNFVGGYAYSSGKYSNLSQEFEYADDQVYGDFELSEVGRLIAGVGGNWNRSRRDLNLENSSLRFKGGFRFAGDYQLLAYYKVYNFDDLQYRDRYFTSNVVEVSLGKSISF